MIQEKKIREITLEAIYIMRTIVICSVGVFLCTKLLFTPIYISGQSMYPTLHDRDFGFSFVLGIMNKEYSRFDVVVAQYKNSDIPWVKRIIALPGETIEYKDDKLYINNEYIVENYFDTEYVSNQTFGGTLNFTTDFGPITLGDDEYFLMGDNRLVSQDSRSVGAFNITDIISKYMFVLYPLQNIHLVTNS